MKVLLSPRLAGIASKVLRGARVLDIGTDHGYIPVYLLQNGVSDFAIAADINEKPLERAMGNIEKAGFTDKILTVCTNGAQGIDPALYDTVIIAGMGGILISEILADIPEDKKLILQPMTGIPELRKYLYENGYEILDEQLAREEEKIYVIITAQKNYKTVKPTDLDIYFGRFDNQQLKKEYAQIIKQKTEKIIAGMLSAKNTDDVLISKYTSLKKELEKIK